MDYSKSRGLEKAVSDRFQALSYKIFSRDSTTALVLSYCHKFPESGSCISEKAITSVEGLRNHLAADSNNAESDTIM